MTPLPWQIEMLGPVGTALSAVVAAKVFRDTQHARRREIAEQRRIRREEARRQIQLDASAIWHKYLDAAFNHPTFSAGSNCFLSSDAAVREQYEWFVDSMLFSCEGVLNAVGEDKYWGDVFEKQFERHSAYLLSDSFKVSLYGYSPELQNRIRGWIKRRTEPRHA